MLVPSTRCGGKPAVSSAGMVSRPPPPAMASIKPAVNATRARMASVVGSTASSRGKGIKKTTYVRLRSDPAVLVRGSCA
ncbi:hypothetical protein D9M68_914670 [compost metagenome]